MKPSLGFNVCGVRFFWRAKTAKVMKFPIGFQFCSPAISQFVEMNTEKTTCVIGAWAPLVMRIDRWISKSKIDESVVGAVAVDVVKNAGRPFAGHVKPRKTMRKESRPVYADDDVSTRCHASDRASSVASVSADCNAPHEHTHRWVVIKQFAQSLRGKIGFSHDALQKLIGQRPAAIHSRALASSF